MNAEIIVIVINVVAWTAIIYFVAKLFLSSSKKEKLVENKKENKNSTAQRITDKPTNKELSKPITQKSLNESNQPDDKNILNDKPKTTNNDISISTSKTVTSQNTSPKRLKSTSPEKRSVKNTVKSKDKPKRKVKKKPKPLTEEVKLKDALIAKRDVFVKHNKLTFKKMKLDNNVVSKIYGFEFNPRILLGDWIIGMAVDEHTLKSFPEEFDENGDVTKWNTTRTDIGELMYKLKYYQGENSSITESRLDKVEEGAHEIVKLMKRFMLKLGHENFEFDVIVPALPSKVRKFQPVPEIAKRISKITGIPLNTTSVRKTKETPELKSIEDPEERAKLLAGKFVVMDDELDRKNILIFDDLYRSGSTVKEIIRSIKHRNVDTNIFLLTITKTKSKR